MAKKKAKRPVPRHIWIGISPPGVIRPFNFSRSEQEAWEDARWVDRVSRRLVGGWRSVSRLKALGWRVVRFSRRTK